MAGDVEGSGAGGGQAGDSVAAVAVEFGVDKRREFVGHVGVPLVNAQDRVRGIPVGVEGISAADGHDHIDVLAGEPRADVGVAHPVHALLATLDAGQLEGAVDEARLGLGGRGGRAGEAEPQGGDRGEAGG